MYNLLIILSLLLFFPYFTHANEPNSSIGIGIVTHDSSGLLISTTEKSLRNDIVLICSPVRQVCKSILHNVLTIVKTNESVEDLATGNDIYTYLLTDDKPFNDIDIAIIYRKTKAGSVNISFDGKNTILITNGDLKYSISFCTSNEGGHIYSNPKMTHLYYSLGYEVMANCSEGGYE